MKISNTPLKVPGLDIAEADHRGYNNEDIR